MLYFINISTKNSLESHFKFMSSLATFFRRLKMIFIVEKKLFVEIPLCRWARSERINAHLVFAIWYFLYIWRVGGHSKREFGA